MKTLEIPIRSLHLKEEYLENPLEFVELVASRGILGLEVLSDISQAVQFNHLNFKFNNTEFWIDPCSRDVLMFSVENSAPSFENSIKDICEFVRLTMPFYRTEPKTRVIYHEDIILQVGDEFNYRKNIPLEFTICSIDKLVSLYIYDLVKPSYIASEIW